MCAVNALDWNFEMSMDESVTVTKNHIPGGGHDIISYQKKLGNHTEHIQVDAKSQKEIPEPQNFI